MPGPGQTRFFIGTSVSTPTSSITVTYSVGGGGSQMTTVAGTQEGNGAFHYIVSLPQGAVVSHATVTGATEHTVVTVSGCLNGPPLPTTTTSAPNGPPNVPPPGGTTVSPETAGTPTAGRAQRRGRLTPIHRLTQLGEQGFTGRAPASVGALSAP